MVNATDIAEVVADVFGKNTWQKSIEVSTEGMENREVAALVDAIFAACEDADVKLKGVIVDPCQLPRPDDAAFENAFYRNGRLVIVDLNLDDRIIVRRA